MQNTLKRLGTTVALLLASATQAAMLTLSPADIGAEPGRAAGWGFSLFNDDASNYLLVTGSEFAPGVPSAFGGGAARLPRSAYDGCSGQAPVSSTPRITPLPAFAVPPMPG